MGIVVITEQEAWKILQAYALEVSQIETATLLAVFAIGSLPGGYYRPGQSDLDAVLLVKDGSESIWGSGKAVSSLLETLNNKYQELCGAKTGFEGYAIQEGYLLCKDDNGMLLEPQLNARLKLQSRLLFGSFDLEKIPLPTRADWLADAAGLEAHWQAQGGDAQLLQMDALALVNHALLKIKQYMLLVQGKILFHKIDLVHIWSELKSDSMTCQGCQLMQRVIDGEPVAPDQQAVLVAFVQDVGSFVNACIFPEL